MSKSKTNKSAASAKRASASAGGSMPAARVGHKSKKGRKPPGAIDYAAIEHALLHGEIRQVGDNHVLQYPSLRELARRHGVDIALLSRWAKKRNIKLLRGLAEAARRGAQEVMTPSEEPPEYTAAVAAAKAARRERAQVIPGLDPMPPSVEAERAARPTPVPAPGVPGRRRIGAPPRYNVEELDKLLVFGHPRPMPDGTVSVYYPTRQEIADQLRIAASTVATHWKKHDCARRRAEARARIMARVEAQLVEETVETIAMSRDRTIAVIDKYIARYEAAVEDGVARTDLASDFDRMVRLKELLTGNAESRAEVQQTLSLELAQRQHAQVLHELEQASAAELGMIIDTTAVERLEAATTDELVEDALGDPAVDGKSARDEVR